LLFEENRMARKRGVFSFLQSGTDSLEKGAKISLRQRFEVGENFSKERRKRSPFLTTKEVRTFSHVAGKDIKPHADRGVRGRRGP